MTKLLDARVLGQLNTTDVRSVSIAVSHRSEAVLRRAENLAKEDQQLVELSLRAQLSHRRIGALMELPPGTVARRLRRIGMLLHDPLIVRLLDGPCPLERTDRQIALGHFLRRQPLRELAMIHRQSVSQISKRLQFVRGWFRGASVRRNAE